METPDDSPHRLSGLLGRLVLTLAGVVLLYVLSIGPACVLDSRVLVRDAGPNDREPLAFRLYKPVWKVAVALHLHDPLIHYCLLWLKFKPAPQ